MQVKYIPQRFVLWMVSFYLLSQIPSTYALFLAHFRFKFVVHSAVMFYNCLIMKHQLFKEHIYV